MTFKSSKELKVTVSGDVDGKTISLESGWIAKQAGGAVIARQGDTMVLCTVCSADPRPGQNFFPMTVEYQEKAYSAGKIPGGFFKREARPGEHEILACRLIDRPLRPMFPKGYMDEVQIICTVISADNENSPDMLALTGASAALTISSLPFAGPVSGVRVGRKDGKFFANGTPADFNQSDIDLVVAGTSDAIAMVEAGAKVVSEKDMLDALDYAHDQIRKLNALQSDLQAKVGKEKVEYVAVEVDQAIEAKVTAFIGNRVVDALAIKEKKARNNALSEIKAEVVAALAEEFPEQEGVIKDIFASKSKKAARSQTVNQKVRIDGRDLTTVRPIECEVDILPRVHGSALFTRGETQAIVSTTLGTGDDAQMLDRLSGKEDRHFMLHYNFPPYSTGEAKMMRGTGRREVGHGALAHRALEPMLPSQTEFPYVIRVVSDVTESNGSSSMATVCGGSMSLAAAGVGIKEMVGGVAMGLIKEGDKFAILTDILGDEDHYGDMDFKVCGTKDGITALQMDIKCDGLTREIMEQALEQARQARLHILGEMNKAIAKPRTELSKFAPQIRSLKINPDKIRDVIGSGGKTIRSICESTNTKINIQDDGTISIAAPDGDAIARAIEIIEGLTAEAEIGKIYTGIVKKIVDFGAFVEILPGVEGLLHISQIANERVKAVEDVLTEGEQVPVRVLDIDRAGKIRLSRKEALEAIQDAV